MIVVMQLGATEAQIQAVAEAIRAKGLEPLVMPGDDRTAIGIPASLTPDQRMTLEGVLSRLEGVNKISETSHPYKLASQEYHRDPTLIQVGDEKIGAGHFAVMAGPCSVEGYEEYREAALMVKACGARILRGGAFKPRTSPYSFQGLRVEGLKIIQQVARETGLVTITEVMSADMVEVVAEHVDILQIGARSMQNYPLLIEAGKSQRPVFLKRGPSATIDEWLLAAEYVLNEGNPNVIMCERGIIAFDRTYTRNLLDLTAVQVLKAQTHLPVIVDPSHGTGVAKFVPGMAKAAMVAGADGIMVEVHPDPAEAKSDGSQTLDQAQFAGLMADLRRLSDYAGVTL
ncbi:MAG TPA: 3-deoxy-7-phosphoheptulonate synthase [Fimbriimonadaceae bacterium]|nr:3-deoxy-7-phosphoheptulonate synthase [Armatimonadota bacterium]HCM74266.1 3-deoxy-7-phosphoheptulonate synthase [Armatimonadota bacterium]HRI74069.1 3-deoxy-7-phosphoheptulonate synthase [Fimbriimonadaceae bacterium]